MNPIVWQILLQIILIALNAVFACAEIAVISVSDAKLAQLIAQGDKRAVRLARLTSQPARFLATIQVAITLSGFLGSAFAADNFAGILVDSLLSLGVPVPAQTLKAVSVVLITLILSYFTLVFGELVPKRLAMKKAESLALSMSGMISALARVASPIVWVLTASTNLVLRLCGLDPNAEEDEVSEEEIRMMVDAGSEKGVIDQEEREFIQNVFEFDDRTVAEFATHGHLVPGARSAEEDGSIGTADAGVNVLNQYVMFAHLGEGKLFQFDLFFSCIDCCFHSGSPFWPGRATHCCMMALIFWMESAQSFCSHWSTMAIRP